MTDPPFCHDIWRRWKHKALPDDNYHFVDPIKLPACSILEVWPAPWFTKNAAPSSKVDLAFWQKDLVASVAIAIIFPSLGRYFLLGFGLLRISMKVRPVWAKATYLFGAFCIICLNWFYNGIFFTITATASVLSNLEYALESNLPLKTFTCVSAPSLQKFAVAFSAIFFSCWVPVFM